MAQVYVNPEEIDVFISVLHRYLEDINNSTGNVKMAFDNLTNTWQDDKRSEFEEEFNELLNFLNHFTENAQDKIAHLQRLSEAAKNYLEQ
jgi:uncharacterized protein YukE